MLYKKPNICIQKKCFYYKLVKISLHKLFNLRLYQLFYLYNFNNIFHLIYLSHKKRESRSFSKKTKIQNLLNN